MHIRENVNISEVYKKKKQTIKKKKFFTKKTVNVLYLLDKYLKMKVYKILEHQMNIYVPTFM